MLLYNICIALYAQIAKIIALWNPKAKQWVDGRKDIFEHMARKINKADKVIWLHVASLGEFEQGRPIIEQVRKEHPEYKILLTFFSPSGYEIRRNYDGADYIFYLPIDTPQNVKRFLDIAHPEIAIFVKYEFWLNYLYELKARNVRTFVISAIFRADSVFFKWYGSRWRQALDSYEQIFVQNEESQALLHEIGFDNVTIAGDTRFDRVAAIAQAAKKIDIVERFKGDSRLFVAGSTWGPDEEILLPLINENRDIKFVVAPHEMDESRIERLMREVEGGAVRYTQLPSNFADSQVLVLDTVGLLSRVYGSAEWAYIGGGFGVGIHNILEAAVYGMPVAFGPKYRKFKEACDLKELGVGCSVKSAEELKAWFAELKTDADYLARLSAIAKVYVGQYKGVTEKIATRIFNL